MKVWIVVAVGLVLTFNAVAVFVAALIVSSSAELDE